MGSVDFGLENVAVAEARVVDLHSRCNKKGCHLGRYLEQNLCETHYFRGR